tara:strand:+ start:370 stop:891 length:522 start_codon:yes stop_codon:yes gene_type:complete
MSESTEYMTATEYGEMHGISKQWACRLAADGRIAGARQHGRIWFVPIDSPKYQKLPMGKVPSLTSSRAMRAKELAQKRIEREIAKHEPKPKFDPKMLSKRGQFLHWKAREGYKIVGQRWLTDEYENEYVGAYWLETETEDEYLARDRAFMDHQRDYTLPCPPDFAAFLAESEG